MGKQTQDGSQAMPVMGQAEIENRIQAFRSDLKTLTDKIMVQKHITSGESFVLAEDQYFSLKYDVSEQFELHPSQIIVAGSGKLGFSIVPRKRYRPFGDESDLETISKLNEQAWAEGKSPMSPPFAKGGDIGEASF